MIVAYGNPHDKENKISLSEGPSMLVRRVTKKGQVTKKFNDLVNEFVERYRPALEALAEK